MHLKHSQTLMAVAGIGALIIAVSTYMLNKSKHTLETEIMALDKQIKTLELQHKLEARV